MLRYTSNALESSQKFSLLQSYLVCSCIPAQAHHPMSIPTSPSILMLNQFYITLAMLPRQQTHTSSNLLELFVSPSEILPQIYYAPALFMPSTPPFFPNVETQTANHFPPVLEFSNFVPSLHLKTPCLTKKAKGFAPTLTQILMHDAVICDKII